MWNNCDYQEGAIWQNILSLIHYKMSRQPLWVGSPLAFWAVIAFESCFIISREVFIVEWCWQPTNWMRIRNRNLLLRGLSFLTRSFNLGDKKLWEQLCNFRVQLDGTSGVTWLVGCELMHLLTAMGKSLNLKGCQCHQGCPPTFFFVGKREREIANEVGIYV